MHIYQMFTILFFLITLTSNEYYLYVSVDTNIEIMFTDKWDRKTGVNPNVTGSPFHDIPRSTYGLEDQGNSNSSNILSTTFIYPDDAGSYSFILYGNSTSNYNLDCQIIASAGFQKCNFNIKSFLNINNQQKYYLTYSENNNIAVVIQKEILNSTLLQDVSAAIALSHIGNGSFGTTLINKATQLNGALDAGDIKKAKIYFASINSWIENAHSNQTQTQYVDDYSYSVLREDLNILNQRINMPQIQQIIKKP